MKWKTIKFIKNEVSNLVKKYFENRRKNYENNNDRNDTENFFYSQKNISEFMIDIANSFLCLTENEKVIDEFQKNKKMYQELCWDKYNLMVEDYISKELKMNTDIEKTSLEDFGIKKSVVENHFQEYLIENEIDTNTSLKEQIDDYLVGCTYEMWDDENISKEEYPFFLKAVVKCLNDKFYDIDKEYDIFASTPEGKEMILQMEWANKVENIRSEKYKLDHGFYPDSKEYDDCMSVQIEEQES